MRRRALPSGINVFRRPSSGKPGVRYDASTDAYVKGCQGTRPGDVRSTKFRRRSVVASLINDGIEAYNTKLYIEALDLYAQRVAHAGR